VTALEDGDPAVRTRTGPVGRFLELFSDEFSRASGDASRQPEAIVLPAVEVGAVRVLVGGEVLRTDADPLGLHRRGDHDGAVVEEGAGVQEPGAVALEPVAADEDPFPVTVRVDPGLRVTGGEGDGLGHAVAQPDAVCQDAAHALVRPERRSLHDPQATQQAQLLRREGRDRLVLDPLVEPLEVADVAHEAVVDDGMKSRSACVARCRSNGSQSRQNRRSRL